MAREDRELTMLDIRDPIGVEIETSEDGRRLWVNVDGICRLRVTFASKPALIDIGEHMTEEIIETYKSDGEPI